MITPDTRGNGKSDKPHTPGSYENDIESKECHENPVLRNENRRHEFHHHDGDSLMIIALNLIPLPNAFLPNAFA